MESFSKQLMGWLAALALVLTAAPAMAEEAPAQMPDENAPAAVEQSDIIVTLRDAGTFNTLLAALDAAGLTESLQTAGPYTLFAPTDAAFAKLPEGKLDELLKPENKESLIALLSYHVVPVRMTAEYAAAAGEVRTLGGQVITVTKDGDKVVINGEAVITEPDVAASNGLIQTIDTVLVP